MMLHYICALPNKKGTAAPLEFISDDPAKIEEWARRHDREGWGVYDCHNPLKPGATRRAKETIAAITSIAVDVDRKDIVETMLEVDARAGGLLLRLSWWNDSGRGRHDRPLYVRLDRGKANMVRTGLATWLKFESVLLDNGDAENDIPGDNVGVLTKWNPPDLRIPMGPADRAAIQASVAADSECREDARAEHWVGKIIAQRFNLDPAHAHDKRRIQATIWELLQDGTLARKEGVDKQRKPRTFIVAGHRGQP